MTSIPPRAKWNWTRETDHCLLCSPGVVAVRIQALPYLLHSLLSSQNSLFRWPDCLGCCLVSPRLIVHGHISTLWARRKGTKSWAARQRRLKTQNFRTILLPIILQRKYFCSGQKTPAYMYTYLTIWNKLTASVREKLSKPSKGSNKNMFLKIKKTACFALSHKRLLFVCFLSFFFFFFLLLS